jgi:hemerythrin-like metal-binding protein
MQFRLPDFLYNLTPFLYIIAGFCAGLSLKTTLAVASGTLLALAGISILVLRFVARRKTSISSKKIILLKTQEKELSNLLLRLRWRKSYESGNFLIDEQHRKIHEIGSELVSKSIKQIDKESILEIQLLFENMTRHIVEHFKDEESFISKINHPCYQKHTDLHCSLLTKCELISRKFSKGHLPTKEILQFIVTDLIADHLRKDDMVFFEWVRG